MSKDINSKVFNEGTQLKLQIFRESFKEWFPVFAYGNSINRIIIYDLFAGSGRDAAGNPGSPLILLNESKGEDYQHCKKLQDTDTPEVIFAFNEYDAKKQQTLQENIENEQQKCRELCTLGTCPFKIRYKNKDFQDIFHSATFNRMMQREDCAKFLLLDQYGFKQISDEVFQQIISFPKTDFIFFITSSYVKRFKNQTAVQKYLHINKLSFEEQEPRKAHKVITEYYRSLIPPDIEYYLHGFTIQKGSNYWGLVFGSSHTYGMEKFLKVCWNADCYSGEANCDLNHDYGELFAGAGVTVKKELVKREIKAKIRNGNITTNREGLKYALKRGCLPKLFVDTIVELKSSGEVLIEGKFNKQSTKIHTVDEYKIILNENNKN